MGESIAGGAFNSSTARNEPFEGGFTIFTSNNGMFFGEKARIE